MTAIVEKYIGTDLIQKIAKDNRFSQEVLDFFISFLDNFLTELKDENALDENEPIEELLSYPLEYISKYHQMIKDGYSLAWSKEYADNKDFCYEDNLLAYCYYASNKVSSVVALTDLKLFCKLKYDDQLITDYLVRMATEADLYCEVGIEKAACDFSEGYKQQIKDGKSDIYAYQYANLISYNYYHKIYCEDYAYAYEKAINNGKDEDYATTYADKYGSELVDIKRRAFIHDDEEMLDYAKEKAEAYINAWEYIRDNKLSNINTFYADYEMAYIGALHPDDPSEWSTVAESKKIAEQKAMERYLINKGN